MTEWGEEQQERPWLGETIIPDPQFPYRLSALRLGPLKC